MGAWASNPRALPFVTCGCPCGCPCGCLCGRLYPFVDVRVCVCVCPCMPMYACCVLVRDACVPAAQLQVLPGMHVRQGCLHARDANGRFAGPLFPCSPVPLWPCAPVIALLPCCCHMARRRRTVNPGTDPQYIHTYIIAVVLRTPPTYMLRTCHRERPLGAHPYVQLGRPSLTSLGGGRDAFGTWRVTCSGRHGQGSCGCWEATEKSSATAMARGDAHPRATQAARPHRPHAMLVRPGEAVPFEAEASQTLAGGLSCTPTTCQALVPGTRKTSEEPTGLSISTALYFLLQSLAGSLVARIHFLDGASKRLPHLLPKRPCHLSGAIACRSMTGYPHQGHSHGRHVACYSNTRAMRTMGPCLRPSSLPVRGDEKEPQTKIPEKNPSPPGGQGNVAWPRTGRHGFPRGIDHEQGPDIRELDRIYPRWRLLLGVGAREKKLCSERMKFTVWSLTGPIWRWPARRQAFQNFGGVGQVLSKRPSRHIDRWRPAACCDRLPA